LFAAALRFQFSFSFRSYIQPPCRAPSSMDETMSLGSRIKRIIRLSGSASIISGAPMEPFGSLTTR
jgi:hypothetical protein